MFAHEETRLPYTRARLCAIEPDGQLGLFQLPCIPCSAARSSLPGRQAESFHHAQNLQSVVEESAGIGSFDWNLETGELHLGRVYLALYGRSSDAIPFTRNDWLAALHPDDRQGVEAAVAASLANPGKFSFEHRVVWPDGTVRWLVSRGRVLAEANGIACRVTGVNIDITELKFSAAALEAENASLDEFAQNAAHDLQGPLRTVSLHAELLEDLLAPRTDPRILEAVHKIRSLSHRMRNTVASLLEYSRLGRAAEPAGQARSLHHQATVALENLESDIAASGAQVCLAGLHGAVSCGPEIAQVFQNLIANSIRYRKPGTAPSVQVTSARKDADWLITVRDDGTGFDMAHAEEIFKPLQRLVGQEIEGSGLGLAICETIVHRYGGKIWAESQQGAGATFCFTLPLLSEPSGAHRTTESLL